jgi:hypothetical protein
MAPLGTSGSYPSSASSILDWFEEHHFKLSLLGLVVDMLTRTCGGKLRTRRNMYSKRLRDECEKLRSKYLVRPSMDWVNVSVQCCMLSWGPGVYSSSQPPSLICSQPSIISYQSWHMRYTLQMSVSVKSSITSPNAIGDLNLAVRAPCFLLHENNHTCSWNPHVGSPKRKGNWEIVNWGDTQTYQIMRM